MHYTAIFGGTFNPLHIGHYKMLEALQNDDSIDKIFLMPDKIPPHKACPFLAADEDRITMCNIAADDFGKAEVCLIEFERDGKSYSYDTVRLLKEKYDDNFAFVCGADMLLYFEKWYRYEELAKELPFIVFRRGDVDDDILLNYIEKLKKIGVKIILMDEVIPTVSSTEIRNDFNNSKRLIPEKIFAYLKNRGVYNAL